MLQDHTRITTIITLLIFSISENQPRARHFENSGKFMKLSGLFPNTCTIGFAVLLSDSIITY